MNGRLLGRLFVFSFLEYLFTPEHRYVGRSIPVRVKSCLFRWIIAVGSRVYGYARVGLLPHFLH